MSNRWWRKNMLLPFYAGQTLPTCMLEISSSHTVRLAVFQGICCFLFFPPIGSGFRSLFLAQFCCLHENRGNISCLKLSHWGHTSAFLTLSPSLSVFRVLYPSSVCLWSYIPFPALWLNGGDKLSGALNVFLANCQCWAKGLYFSFPSCWFQTAATHWSSESDIFTNGHIFFYPFVMWLED